MSNEATNPRVITGKSPQSSHIIKGVPTSITAFIGRALQGPVNEPVAVNSFADFERIFGGLQLGTTLGYAVRDFYLNGGTQALIVRLFHPFEDAAGIDVEEASRGDLLDADDFIGAGKEEAKEGLYALEKADIFNLLCIPPYLASDNVDRSVLAAATLYCEKRRAMLIIDPPKSWTSKDAAKSGLSTDISVKSSYAAIYFPRFIELDQLNGSQELAPCGAVAGVIARTDAERGVWKAPAGEEANLVGVSQLSLSLKDAETYELNSLGINCLRTFPNQGHLVWGARTLEGDDQDASSERKYIPVRRLALFIEESIKRGTEWARFEPNGEPLWAELRASVGEFMHNLFLQGAFQGIKPQEAYFVKCDSQTTTRNDIDSGVLNILVGFAPLKPAEFVVLRIQQILAKPDDKPQEADKKRQGCLKAPALLLSLMASRFEI